MLAPDGSKTFGFYEQAEAAARAVVHRVDDTYTDAGVPVVRQSKRYTFSEYAREEWLPTQGGTARTRETREYCPRALERAFGEAMIDELTEADFLRWDAAEQARGMSTSTRQQRMWVLRGVMKRASGKDGVRMDNPAAELWVKKHRIRQLRYLSEQELILLLVFLPFWFWPAALLGYYCGLRRWRGCGGSGWTWIARIRVCWCRM